MKWDRDRNEDGGRMRLGWGGGGKLRNGFLHTYLHSTQMVYEKIIDQTLIGLHTDSFYQA